MAAPNQVGCHHALVNQVLACTFHADKQRCAQKGTGEYSKRGAIRVLMSAKQEELKNRHYVALSHA